MTLAENTAASWPPSRRSGLSEDGCAADPTSPAAKWVYQEASIGFVTSGWFEYESEDARVLAAPWLLATGEDFRWPSTAGDRPGAATRLMHRYIDRLFPLAATRPAVKRALQEVMHMVAGPGALFRPGVAAAVLADVLGAGR